MKKLLSLVLALAMVLTAVAAFAEGEVNVKPDKDTGDVHLDYSVGGDGPSVSNVAGNIYVITTTTIITDESTHYENSYNNPDGLINESNIEKTTESNVEKTTESNVEKTTESNVEKTTESNVEKTTESNVEKTTESNIETTTSESNIEKTTERTSEKETAGDISGSYNTYDNSVRDSYNDNSVTETTTNTDSGNASASASAAAVAGEGKTKTKNSSSSGSSESSSSSKGASSSASASAKASASAGSGSSGSSSSSTTVAPSIQLVVVPDTAETTALKNAFAEAIKAGDPKTALPENVASKLSADLKTVNEFVTAKLVGDITGIASATVNVVFPTKYAAGDKVVILFGIPNGSTTQWINVNGIIESDGSISMILTSTVLEALSGKTFAMAVLSK